MGTSWSQESQDSSRQAQPAIPSEPQAAIPIQPGKTTTTTTSINYDTNNNNNNNNINNKNKNNEVNRKRKELLKPPHNFEAIIKEADSPIDHKSAPEKLYEQLHAGIYLHGRMKKYWLKKGNINCFMVFASGLSITWVEDKNYWQLHNVQTSEGHITVAALRSVCWLEVHGKFNTANLTPGVTYEVAYMIKLEYSSSGWEAPVNFRLTLPNGSKQEHKEHLKDKPRGEWVRIPVGEFKASPEILGEIEFSLYEYENGNWKKGLVIKGVMIEPKFQLT